MQWRSSSRVRPSSGFIEPCIPTPSKHAPVGPDWVYEIKQDGYRLMVRKHNDRVRIYTRRGADRTKRFPRIVKAVQRLRVISVLLDGEGIVSDHTGMANFDLCTRKSTIVTYRWAFDLLELNGEDFRKRALLDRKTRLQKLLAKITEEAAHYNEHIEGEGSVVFKHACMLGCEGIVAKRKDLPYESGRSRRWLK
jgi:bifunctional non-homologous end joining protein LigD